MPQPANPAVADRCCRRWLPCFFSAASQDSNRATPFLANDDETSRHSIPTVASGDFQSFHTVEMSLGPTNEVLGGVLLHPECSTEQLVQGVGKVLQALQKKQLPPSGEEAVQTMGKALKQLEMSFKKGADPAPRVSISREACSSSRPIAAMRQSRLSVCSQQGFGQALNDLIAILWPRIGTYVNNLIRESIEPSINDSLPGLAKGSVKFTKTSLGASTPILGPFVTEHNSENDSIEFHIGIDFSSDLDFEVSAMRIPIGISKIFLKGDLICLFAEAMTKPPFFGGLEVYFPNPPDIDIHFGGAAKIADVPGLRGAIRGAIDGVVAGICVLPRRIAVDMNEEDSVDIVDLKYPEPIAILRFTLFSAKDLIASDPSFFSKATSDPYVVVSLGVKKWTSPTIMKNLNPSWGDSGKGITVDFPVHDDCQAMTIKVYDYDFGTSDDLIGIGERVEVCDLVHEQHRQDLKLLHPEGGEKNAGQITVSASLLSLTSMPPDAAQLPGGPSVAHLSFKAYTIKGFELGVAHPFKVRIQVVSADAGTVGRKTPKEHVFVESCTQASHPPEMRMLAESYQAIASNLHEKGESPGAIAEILEVHEMEVRNFLQEYKGNVDKSGSSIKQILQHRLELRSVRRPRFDEVVQMLLPCECMEGGDLTVLRLIVLDKKSHTLATASVPMSKLLNAPDLDVEGPFTTDAAEVEIVGSLRIRWLDRYPWHEHKLGRESHQE